MSTAVMNFLTRQFYMRSRSDGGGEERRSSQGDGATGIVLQPWILTLLISFIVNFVGFAYTWGTVITRIEALDSRVQRIERQLDQQEKTRHQP